MRILLINRNHFVEGGADRVYLNTGELLRERGHDVAYFSTTSDKNLATEYARYFIENTTPRHLSPLRKLGSVKRYLYNSGAVKSLNRLIDDFRPDVAHVHLFYGALSASILRVLKNRKIPSVITIHDYRLLCPVNAFLDTASKVCEMCKDQNYYHCVAGKCSGGGLLYSGVVSAEAYIRKYLIRPTEHIDHFIFVSDFSMNKHIEFDRNYGAKCSRLYNFADLMCSEDAKKGEYLLYYGRISKEKGISTLVSAVKRTGSLLKIAGGGPQEREIRDLVEGCHNIEYVGFKTGDELKKLIRGSSFVVVPSEWYENNPMTVVESFSLSKPVIGSRVGGIPELVGPDTGFVFDHGDENALVKAINGAEEVDAVGYDRLSRNCVEFAHRNFSKNAHAMELERIYERVIRPC